MVIAGGSFTGCSRAPTTISPMPTPPLTRMVLMAAVLACLDPMVNAFVPTGPVLLGVDPPVRADGDRPWFDSERVHNVTALLSSSGYLTCHIRSLLNRTVSWVRHKDVRLLTVAEQRYTDDRRFSAHHATTTHEQTKHHPFAGGHSSLVKATAAGGRPRLPAGAGLTTSTQCDEWTLKIRAIKHEDAGMYACQVSTSPPVSYPVFLSVIEPEVEILGGPEVYVDLHSTVNLTCVISNSPQPPAFVFWLHNKQAVDVSFGRGGVFSEPVGERVTASRLIIHSARLSDTGLYSCQPANAPTKSVKLHVIDGDAPAAMQTSSSCHAPSLLGILLTLLLHLSGGATA